MFTKINDIDLKILSLFTKGYNKELYIREVERLLKISSKTALIVLNKLENEGILKSKKIGKTKVYFTNKSLITKEFFVLAEQYKKIQFLKNKILIKEIIEKTDSLMKGIVIIFGSYAKNKEKENSDLDLFIVGKFYEKKIKNIGKKYGININIQSYTKKIFEKEINKDILLKEIKENHILIKGIEKFVDSVIQWKE